MRIRSAGGREFGAIEKELYELLLRQFLAIRVREEVAMVDVLALGAAVRQWGARKRRIGGRTLDGSPRATDSIPSRRRSAILSGI